MQCRLAKENVEAEWSDCSSGHRTVVDLEDGAYVFEVRAEDRTGEVTDPPAFRVFRVSTQGPVARFYRSPPAVGRGVDADFGFTLSVPAAGPVTCRLDEGRARRCTDGTARFAGLAEGPHTFSVTATDQFGQTATTRVEFILDRTAPLPSVSAAPNPFTPDGDGREDEISFDVSTDELATVEVVVETEGGMQVQRLAGSLGTAFRARWDGTDAKGMLCPPATYRYFVLVTDRAGNQITTGGFLTIALPAA